MAELAVRVNGSGPPPSHKRTARKNPPCAGPAAAGCDASRPDIARVYDWRIGGQDRPGR
jgi:hypothetical protein